MIANHLKSRSRGIQSGTVLLLLALTIVGYRHFRVSQIDGTWWKLQEKGDLPDEMTLRLTKREFVMRFWKDGGVEQVTLLLDANEHPFEKIAGVMSETYRARLNGETLVITKRLRTPGVTGEITERWLLASNGQLKVSSVSADSTFRRKPLLSYLFHASP